MTLSRKKSHRFDYGRRSLRIDSREYQGQVCSFSCGQMSSSSGPNTNTPFSRYRVGEVLGRGSFSTARDCICLSSNRVHAVKVIRSDNDYNSQWSSCSMFRREVEFLRSLGTFDFVDFHPCINATRSSEYCEIYRIVPG